MITEAQERALTILFSKLATKYVELGTENVYQVLKERFDSGLIDAMLEANKGNKTKTAAQLGISRNTISDRVKSRR